MGGNAIHHVHKRIPLKAAALCAGGHFVTSGGDKWDYELPHGYDLASKISRTYRNGRKVEFLSTDKERKPRENYNYFLRRDTGYITWAGPASLCTLIDNEDVSKVFFAPGDGWLAVKSDGSVAWKDLPYHMSKALKKNAHRYGGVEYASVAPDTEAWFILYGNGRMAYDDLPSTLDQALEEEATVPQLVELGANSTFVALWPDYTLFCGEAELCRTLLGFDDPSSCSGGHACGCTRAVPPPSRQRTTPEALAKTVAAARAEGEAAGRAQVLAEIAEAAGEQVQQGDELELVVEEEEEEEATAKEVSDRFECSVCMEDLVGMVFAGCGHMLCPGCADQMEHCPMCRKKSRKIRLYRV